MKFDINKINLLIEQQIQEELLTHSEVDHIARDLAETMLEMLQMKNLSEAQLIYILDYAHDIARKTIISQN